MVSRRERGSLYLRILIGSNKKNLKKAESPCDVGLNAMPFRGEARKCNHWASAGLLESGNEFNGTYSVCVNEI